MAYSDEQKAIALAALEANGGNVNRTAKFLNMRESTLRNWANGVGVNEDVTQNCEQKKRTLAERLDALAHRILDLTGDSDITDAPLSQRMVALGIAVEKSRLLQESSTAIIDERTNLTDAERGNRITQLLDAARARRDGRALDDEDAD